MSNIVLYFMKKIDNKWKYIDILTNTDIVTFIIRRYEKLGWSLIDMFWGYSNLQIIPNKKYKIVVLHAKKYSDEYIEGELQYESKCILTNRCVLDKVIDTYRFDGWFIERSKSSSVIKEILY